MVDVSERCLHCSVIEEVGKIETYRSLIDLEP